MNSYHFVLIPPDPLAHSVQPGAGRRAACSKRYVQPDRCGKLYADFFPYTNPDADRNRNPHANAHHPACDQRRSHPRLTL